MQGLKVIAERGMSKITKANIPDEDTRRAEIKAKAEANVQDMYDGKVKITGAKTVKKASGAVMTEAMRLARNLIKDAMKANKIKISTVKASEITKAAKAYIESNPSLIATAEKNLQEREQTPMTIDIKSLIHVDPELVAKAEAKAAKAKADKPLSAKQAGKVAPRAKGAKPSAQANA
jgi:UDP-N-acetylglucosamine enolpyruvyl transferase